MSSFLKSLQKILRLIWKNLLPGSSNYKNFYFVSYKSNKIRQRSEPTGLICFACLKLGFEAIHLFRILSREVGGLANILF